MLESKKFNVLLSLLFAIGLWIYVVGEVNPTSEETFKDIGVSLTNTDILADKGLAVSSTSAESIEVQVKGSRTDIAHLNKDSIKATLDMADARKGENEIDVNIRVPDGIEVVKKSMSKVVVTVEKLKKKEVGITIDYKGLKDKSQEVNTLRMSAETVEVKGAETLVDSVSTALAVVDASEVKNVETSLESTLSPIDNKGNPVKRVSIEPSKVKIVSVISTIKTLELKVPIVNNSTDNKIRKFDAPKEITVVGREETLKNLDSITSEPIDITDQPNGSLIPIKITLPEGIKLSDKNKELVGKVIIETQDSRTFDYTKDDIHILGIKDDLTYEVDKDLKVTLVVKGKEDILKQLKKSDFKIIGSVEELGLKDNTMQLSVETDKQDVALSLTPEKVHIVIEEKNK